MGVWSRILKLAEKASEAWNKFRHSEAAIVKEAARAEPGLVEEGAKAAKFDKPRVTLEDAQKAKADRIAAEKVLEAEKAAKAAGQHAVEKLNDLTPGRFGRDQLDSRLKALNETAKEHGLVDANLVREKGKVLNPKQAEEALRTGKPITPDEMTKLQDSKQAAFDKWEANVATNKAKNEAIANGKGGTSTLKTGIATAAVAVGAVGAGIAYVSPEGPGVFTSYGKAKVDKALTDTQVAATQANNLADIQSSGGIQTPKKAAGKLAEADVQALVAGNLKDYVAFANNKELDPKNIAPDITPQQSTALMLAFTNAQKKAREDTNEANKGLVGKTVSLVAGKDDTPITVDSSNMALFMDNFRKNVDEELKGVPVPAKTKEHLMISLFDPTQQESVASKLAQKLDLTR